MVSTLISGPSSRRSNSQCSQKISRLKIVDVAEVYHWHCLEESGQWLENVDQPHQILASGKLVLQQSLGFECSFVEQVDPTHNKSKLFLSVFSSPLRWL